jgi:uncharacterized membrane protein
VVLLLLVIRHYFDSPVLYIAIGLVSSAYVYVLASDVREAVKKGEYLRYVLFFLPLIAAVNLSLAIPLINSELYIYSFAAPAAIIVAVFASSFLFSRGFVYAKVMLSGNGTAAVEKDFDLASLTRSGRFIVSSEGKVQTGKEVKVAVKTTLSGRKPYKIIYDD